MDLHLTPRSSCLRNFSPEDGKESDIRSVVFCSEISGDARN